MRQFLAVAPSDLEHKASGFHDSSGEAFRQAHNGRGHKAGRRSSGAHPQGRRRSHGQHQRLIVDVEARGIGQALQRPFRARVPSRATAEVVDESPGALLAVTAVEEVPAKAGT